MFSFGENGYLLLEYENRQNHPSTNVAKLWPWLEENTQRVVILVQVYQSEKSSSRKELAEWLGRKMELDLPKRFAYVKREQDNL